MSAPIVEWGVAGKPYPGETRSGDNHVVVHTGNRALIGVIDGIGHGNEAADAASAAVEIIESHAADPVDELICRCHERLSQTRGAAMTLASFDGAGKTLTWLGAGNVLAALARRDRAGTSPCSDLLVRSGVVGAWLPHLRTSSISVQCGDVLVLTTDGINSNFIDTVRVRENLQHQANRILESYQNFNDDALVLVVRLNGISESHVEQQ